MADCIHLHLPARKNRYSKQLDNAKMSLSWTGIECASLTFPFSVVPQLTNLSFRLSLSFFRYVNSHRKVAVVQKPSCLLIISNLCTLNSLTFRGHLHCWLFQILLYTSCTIYTVYILPSVICLQLSAVFSSFVSISIKWLPYSLWKPTQILYVSCLSYQCYQSPINCY